MICLNCEVKLRVIDSRPTSFGSNERLQKCKCKKCGQEYQVSVLTEYPDKHTCVITECILMGYPA